MGLILSILSIIVFVVMTITYDEYKCNYGGFLIFIAGVSFVFGVIRLIWWLSIYVNINI